MYFKKLLLLLPLASCITINQGGVSPAASPRAMMLAASPAAADSPELMAYKAKAVLTSFNLEKTRLQSIKTAKAIKGEVLQDGTDLIVVRVPSAQLTNYIESLKKFGKLESFSIQGDNIAQVVKDNSLRIETLEITRVKYQDILKQAVKVQDILAASREIEQIDYQLQNLQQRKDQDEQRTAFSEVAVQLKKRSSFGPLGWILYFVWCSVKWFFWWG